MNVPPKRTAFASPQGARAFGAARQARGGGSPPEANCVRFPQGAIALGRPGGDHGVNGNRFQSLASCHSRDARALTWKGLGSWLTSRRRRTAAS